MWKSETPTLILVGACYRTYLFSLTAPYPFAPLSCKEADSKRLTTELNIRFLGSNIPLFSQSSWCAINTHHCQYHHQSVS